MTIDELLDKYRESSANLEKEKGDKFERLMKNFMLTYPAWSNDFENVWLWNEFPLRGDLGSIDLGIDIVAKTKDGKFWAAQCKFYAETTTISKDDVAAFIANSGRHFDDDKFFSRRLWFSTSDKFTDNAREIMKNQTPEIEIIDLEILRDAKVEWDKLNSGIFGEKALKKERSPQEHQIEAINAAEKYFEKYDRGKLIMACGTGKTFTSLKIAQKLFPNGKILFVVPSISLINQVINEWTTFAGNPIDSICVCSDETVGKKNDDDSVKDVTTILPVTTDPKEISNRLRQNKPNANLKVVFSTYQSLDKISEAQKILGDNFTFDLIICDEAHRTTGSAAKETEFTAVHNDNFIRAKKRLYMTATPRLYTSDAKAKAKSKDFMLWSMDDTSIFGEEFFSLDFGTAIDKNLLSDYRVIVFRIPEDTISAENQKKFKEDSKVPIDEQAKLTGCVNALNKKIYNASKVFAQNDTAPMKKAVAFCSKISKSKETAAAFKEIEVKAEHIDGTMSSSIRSTKLKWLEDAEDECRILCNVRCLSEGVDVPSLDAIIFLSSRKSKVEIVQAVGRVMRKAPDKKYGYIIIPVIVPVDKNPEEVLMKNKDFDVVWDVINALRAHDKRVDIFIEQIKLNRGKPKPYDENTHILITEAPHEDIKQTSLDFDGNTTAVEGIMVERVGNRRYWELWAKDIADIAEHHMQRIEELTKEGGKYSQEFSILVYDLNRSLNSSVNSKALKEMLAQHLISRPVFDVIFQDYPFVKNNPVSRALEKFLAIVGNEYDEHESRQLKEFYDSVTSRCQILKSPEDKQETIIDLYDRFFRLAMPLTVEKLGIVYTPVEVVDFILRSVDAVLWKNFKRHLSSPKVNVLDPFTGTGTFIVRLIQSNMIKTNDLIRKYQKELFANEIVLLAYYIASVNIENAFHDKTKSDEFIPFNGICLADTFQSYEQDEHKPGEIDMFGGGLAENAKRLKHQLDTEINVVIGNPPYSVGQRSANDNAQNDYYEKLENRIAATYAAQTNAILKNSLYDSYIKAFRWASDRIKDCGVIGFVTNSGWLDAAAMDGLRKCFAKEFSEIYIFNLRGNARTQGELRRREAGNVFGGGSRAPIAITILVKNPEHEGDAKIFYRAVDDYLTREQKLYAIKNTSSVLDENFKPLTPNDKGDWINQRGDKFDNYLPLAPAKKFDARSQSFFVTYSNGVKTNRDVWCYNFSRDNLEKNINTTIDYYNTHESTEIDSTKFVWTSSSVANKNCGREYKFNPAQIVESVYRPFCRQNLYYDEGLNERCGQIPKIFPTGAEENLLICVTGVGSSKEISVMIVDKIPCYDMVEKSQCFPLYWYEVKKGQINLFNGEADFERHDGVSDYIQNFIKMKYGKFLSKEDIFYFVYGYLHLPAYRETFAAELKKSLPRLDLPSTVEKFFAYSHAGRALAEIHLHYEQQEPPAGVEIIGAEKNNFAVEKIKFASKDDKTTLIYNDDIKIKNIPLRSYEYVVNGRSPLEWIIDRYQVKTDAASGITNDPNAWGAEHKSPRYILDLIMSCITVSLKTLEIVEGLKKIGE
ncbi:MAG: DEAD/DEAH box helicase family protein [Selenomonadaceae bacterium]|nr:DEAD/DEAH box helicase family protein [Selenomonadaceae bacterium]